MSALPPGLHVWQRGWLSSNVVLAVDAQSATLFDSGYHTHAAQLHALLAHTLGARALDRLVHTHLHSDHCGGTAALQAAYPALRVGIPPGEAAAVRAWDAARLSYQPTGQHCPRFTYDHLLEPGQTLQAADLRWQVLAAPGHDTHAVLFFAASAGLLIAGDALWQDGFGVVFPQLQGEPGFDDVAATLDLIESLAPSRVIPGHGAAFSDVADALKRARQRLAAWVADPLRHRRYAARVLLKFKLLAARRLPRAQLHAWAQTSAYLQNLLASLYPDHDAPRALERLADDLCASQAARWQDDALCDADA